MNILMYAMIMILTNSISFSDNQGGFEHFPEGGFGVGTTDGSYGRLVIVSSTSATNSQMWSGAGGYAAAPVGVHLPDDDGRAGGYAAAPILSENNPDDEWIHWVLEMFGYDMDDDAFEELIEHLQNIRRNPFFIGTVSADQLRDLVFLDEFEIRKILEWVSTNWSDDAYRFTGTQHAFVEAGILDEHLAQLFTVFVRFIDTSESALTTKYPLAADNIHDYESGSEVEAVNGNVSTPESSHESEGVADTERNRSEGPSDPDYLAKRSAMARLQYGGLAGNLRVRTEIRAGRPVQKAFGYDGYYLGSPLRYQERTEITHSKFSAHYTRSKQSGERMMWPVETGFQTSHVLVTGFQNVEILIGDYTVRHGSGLVFGSGGMRQGLRTGGVVVTAGTRVRPYRSGTSGSFMRGVMVGGVVRGVDVLVFGSERRLAATPFLISAGDGNSGVEFGAGGTGGGAGGAQGGLGAGGAGGGAGGAQGGLGAGGAGGGAGGAQGGLGAGGAESEGGAVRRGVFMPGWGAARRTQADLARFGNLRLRTLGATVGGRRSLGVLEMGLSFGMAGNWFGERIAARPDRWNAYDFEGQHLWQWSLAGEVLGPEWLVAGEAAGSGSGGTGWVWSARWAEGPFELGVLGRSLPADFHTVYGQAPGAWSGAGNEQGFGAWLQWRGLRGLRVRLFADGYRSPGARYGSDVGVWGRERGAAVLWRQGRAFSSNVEFYRRLDLYPAIVTDVSGREYRARLDRNRSTLRGSVRMEPGSGWMVLSRLEVQSWTGDVPAATVKLELPTLSMLPNSLLIDFIRDFGYGWTQTIRYRNKFLEIIVQHTIFNTDSFNTRIYAFEYDLAGQLRVPAWSGQGQRSNIVAQFTAPGRYLILRLKLGHTLYTDRFEVGTGNDATQGPTRTDLAGQLIINF
jgi:hypothetical protein